MPAKLGLKDALFFTIKLFILTAFVASCSPIMSARNENVDTKDTEITESVYAAVKFQVFVPDDYSVNEEDVYLDVLDEVTGIGLNPKRYPMEKKEESTYEVRIPIIVGSVVKYRYSRGSPPAIEYTPDREQVRYRLFYVNSPAEVNDQISGWIDHPYQSSVGRIQGTIINNGTNQAVSNVLVTAGGVHTLSSADGTFLLEGLPVGTHNLVVYSLDGDYQVFQQGAVVAAESTTPVSISLFQQPKVDVTFVVKPPQDSIPGIPIRIIGNIYSLGNTFADLDGGVNAISSRTPLMSLTSDGMYFLTLSLPVGLDLRYKYTLGDGFWNAEHKSDGSFFTRQLIVPDEDIIIEDAVDTWKTGIASKEISFIIKAPDNTPVNDTISIQFSPYSWMEPIPMWPMGNNEWLYVLYGPLNIDSERVLYRFCRNDQCGFADDAATHGQAAGFDYFNPNSNTQTIEYNIESWAGWQDVQERNSENVSEISARSDSFLAGIEMQPGYHPNWQPYTSWGIESASELGANWIIETPTWSYTRNNLPVLELLPGSDALIYDEVQIGQWVMQNNQKLALFPMVNFPDVPEEEWWINAAKDPGWWQSWFDRYRTYLLNFADLANQLDAEALILGENSLLPALPNGVLIDGTASGVPSSTNEYWPELLAEIRQRYDGEIFWAVQYSGEAINIPDFVSQVDKLYILWSVKVDANNITDIQNMTDEFNSLLEKDIYNLKETYQKSIIIAADIPSSSGNNSDVNSVDASVESDGQQTDVVRFDNIDLEMQARYYDALLSSINQHSWVDGCVSRGFSQTVAVQDSSTSIHGKPASDIVKYWYSNILSTNSQ